MQGTKKGRLVVPLAMPVSSALPTQEDEAQRISAFDYSNGTARFGGEDISTKSHEEATWFAKVPIATLSKMPKSNTSMLSTYTKDDGNVLFAFGDDMSSSTVDNGNEKKVPISFDYIKKARQQKKPS